MLQGSFLIDSTGGHLEYRSANVFNFSFFLFIGPLFKSSYKHLPFFNKIIAETYYSTSIIMNYPGWRYNQTCVKRPYKLIHICGFSDRGLLITA